MTKIYVNYTALENNVLYDVNNSLVQLKKAINDIGTIRVPYEFEYAQYVKNIFDKNLSTYNKLMSKKNKIEKIVSNFKLVEKNNFEMISRIAAIDLDYRKKIIN